MNINKDNFSREMKIIFKKLNKLRIDNKIFEVKKFSQLVF